jgi:hypothetical protein
VKVVDVDGGHIVVVRVPRSWCRPHMVSLGTTSRFYMRDSVGKHPMDAIELRDAFGESELNIDRVRDFRNERVADISGGRTPVPLVTGTRVVLHLVTIPKLSVCGIA